MHSMTGFATKTITITRGPDQKAHISLHLKTLNGRYFEANIKLPPTLSYLETDLLKLFKNTLQRGTVNFAVYLDNPSLFKGSIEPALSTVKGYIAALNKIKKECNLNDPITIATLVRLPNIFNVEEQVLDKQSADAILATTDELIAAVIHERKKEGTQLKKDIEKRVTFLTKEINRIEKRSHQHIAEQKEKLQQLIQELSGDDSDSAATRKNTLYGILDKINIHEEIVRFKSHLHNIKELLKQPTLEKGKRLDFILQELAREINTITAKCSDALISNLAINVKVDIEKAREQVQNIV
jgi:uncharacterized protein (TIGR00255 family)